MSALARYDAVRAAIVEASQIDDILPLLDEFEIAKLRAKQIKDHAVLAEATEFEMRAERRLGEIIKAAKAAGLFKQGRQREEKSTDPELFPRGTLIDAGIDKKLSVRSQGLAELEIELFESTVKGMREQIESRGARVLNPLSTAEKQERRADRERELGEKIAALPSKRYGVIYADPEWRFEPWSRSTGMDRAADNHYATSTVEEIASRDVASISYDDCVLFLWVTVPMLPAGLYVMERWGFTYQTNIVWCKEKIGTGYWFRNRHELLLVGTKGKPVAPAMGTQWDSIARPRDPEHHSEKPQLFRKIIEAYYPTTPKIELNAADEEEWPGWSRWGAPHRKAAE